MRPGLNEPSEGSVQAQEDRRLKSNQALHYIKSSYLCNVDEG